tara:strand:+ start:1731 stop:3005 length:1275 start_codon:yes stop_codon:yes gene_type:complete
VAQSFRPPEDPLEDLPEPQPDVQGAANTSLDCSSNVYEKQELLHRPHAFALMHGENGAKVAYGELHWAIDVLIANFKTTTISVNDHCDHSHEPHDSHTDHSHAPHNDHKHSQATHTHPFTHSHTIADHAHPISPDVHQGHTGLGTGSSSSLTGSGSYTSDDPATGSYDEGNEYTHDHGGQTGSSIVGGGPQTVGQSASSTDSNTADHTSGVKSTSSSGASSVAAEDGVLKHSGVTAPNGTDAAAGTVLGHTDHSGVKDTDGTSTAPDCVLKHTLTVVEDGVTITESGASVTIDHVDKMGQLPIPDITQQVPNIDKEDGVSMLSEIPNEYFQLTGFGDVYLVWKVDLELAPEVQKCWVQVGEPDTSPISSIGVSSAVTDRLDNDPESSSTEGTYSVKIGTVTEDNKIQQRVSGDVSWRPVVLDRT